MSVKDTPTICFLVEIWSEMIVWSYRHTWYHFWAFPVTMTSFEKKFEKLLISRFLVSEYFFRNEYKHVVISIVYASKWWVTWPFFHYAIGNDHFDGFIGKFISTSGLMIDLSWHDYFWDHCLLGFNLRYHTWQNLIILRKSSEKL